MKDKTMTDGQIMLQNLRSKGTLQERYWAKSETQRFIWEAQIFCIAVVALALVIARAF